MPMYTAAEIVTEALDLPESERTWIVSKILKSFDSKQSLSVAWRKEISERIDRREAGEIQHVSSEQVHQDIQAIISAS